MAASIPLIEKLSARVIRILGCNPGAFTLQGTNSYLVGSGKRRILIDTTEPNHPQYLHNVGKVLEETDIKVQEIVVTHWHHDHVGAVKELCRDVLKERVKVSKMRRIQGVDVDLEPEAAYSFLAGDETFSTEGATLRVIPTPGHSDDHFSLHLVEENAIFSGDCVLGEGTTIFEDLYDYMESLHRLVALKPGVIYPGHGPLVPDGEGKLREYIEHREMRESQIVEALRTDGGAMTAMALVKIIYTDISPALHMAAMGNVLQHLGKLYKERKVGMDRSEEEVMSAMRRCGQEGSERSQADIHILMSTEWQWKNSSAL